MMDKERPPLRRGWTTGACATGATKAAFTALAKGMFPDPITITLPKNGGETAFTLAAHQLEESFATASIIKDAGDDPDVTHGALVTAKVTKGTTGKGVRFFAGEGVGTITRPGLPLPPGEPAINPVPREMMRQAIAEVSAETGLSPDVDITISIENGEELAQHTLNGRLGIVGGLSVLGTTGIVRPFSCAAWISSIHRGVDVARASGLQHVVGATGSSSEDAVRQRYALDEAAYLDMGDFAGGLLKYLRAHPVPHLTLSGGFAKFTKLAQGALDLHSARSRVDPEFLAKLLSELQATDELIDAAKSANTAKEILDLSAARGIDLAAPIAQRAKVAALALLKGAPVDVEVLVTDRQGKVIGETGFSTETDPDA